MWVSNIGQGRLVVIKDPQISRTYLFSIKVYFHLFGSFPGVHPGTHTLSTLALLSWRSTVFSPFSQMRRKGKEDYTWEVCSHPIGWNSSTGSNVCSREAGKCDLICYKQTASATRGKCATDERKGLNVLRTGWGSLGERN